MTSSGSVQMVEMQSLLCCKDHIICRFLCVWPYYLGLLIGVIHNWRVIHCGSLNEAVPMIIASFSVCITIWVAFGSFYPPPRCCKRSATYSPAKATFGSARSPLSNASCRSSGIRLSDYLSSHWDPCHQFLKNIRPAVWLRRKSKSVGNSGGTWSKVLAIFMTARLVGAVVMMM